ncbi:HAD family hydrolase [Pelomonas sp. Root1444]|uniref:HAD family hydrolase n=1 Tax=Pelomonas sp. Root1444 TaxID=1736464 RepID=UPI000702FA63|nr:HAD-IA family hydrolase [Pelomonas sp. Root1444]KQY82856.1 HAD family hydrolase [Pelomonas sp. Root1444]
MTTRPQRFDLIAFDWDGTLFDSTALIARCIQRAAVDIGLPEPELARAKYVIGLGLRDALEHAVPGLAEERYPELGLRYRHHYLASEHELSLFDGTLEMLQALKARHHWLAVATGKNRVGLDRVLASSALGHLFDGSRTADETRSKPHPQMLMELMREFGAEPERTLMIGDTTHDLQLAANAGTPCVAVSFGAHDHETFAEFKPLFVAHSTRELHDWLIEHA